jgi:hypothetical protein
MSTPAPLPRWFPIFCPLPPRSRTCYAQSRPAPATIFIFIPQQSRIHVWSSRNSPAIVVDRLCLICTPNLIYFITYFSRCVIETFNNWHSNDMYQNTTRSLLFIDFIWTKWNKTETYLQSVPHIRLTVSDFPYFILSRNKSFKNQIPIHLEKSYPYLNAPYTNVNTMFYLCIAHQLMALSGFSNHLGA